MSKKSARSKGYRKNTKKKSKGYTPQEKRIMIIGFAVIILVIIGIVVIPDWVESFSLLDVDSDGVVQGLEDNWLICNVGTSSNKKYRKLAEVETPEGYELSSTEDGLTDSNLRYFIYEPTGDSVAENITIQSGSGEASELVETYRTTMSSFSEILYSDDEITETTVNGANIYAFVMEYRMESTSTDEEETADDTEDEDTEDTSEDEETAEEETAEEETSEEETAEDETSVVETAEDETEEEDSEDEEEKEEDSEDEEETTYTYYQGATIYIDSPIDEKCVVIQAAVTGEDDSVFVDRDALMEIAMSAAACVTFDD